MGSKIGRNQQCPCGSEKKYKRCCLSKRANGTTAVGSSSIEPDSKTLVQTDTGEILQLVRLYYNILDYDGLVRAFSRLDSIRWDDRNARWVWLYAAEAEHLTFEKPYAALQGSPRVLASLRRHGDSTLVADLRSFERATSAIVFFDAHVDRTIARVTHAAVWNKLPTPSECSIDLDTLFDEEAMHHPKPNEMVDDLKERAERIADPEERTRFALDAIDAKAREPLHAVEKLSVLFYEDGIESLKLALRARQMVALEHWKGDSEFSKYDFAQTIAQNVTTEPARV